MALLLVSVPALGFACDGEPGSSDDPDASSMADATKGNDAADAEASSTPDGAVVDAALSESGAPGIDVSAPSPSAQTTEVGGAVTFTVRLRSKPAAAVTIALASTNAVEGRPDRPQLVFTPATWSQPQTVTVTGQDDAVADGDVPYTIMLAKAQSSDAAYAAIDPPDVELTNVDNDAAGLVVSAPAPSDRTSEAGDPITFTVRLQSQPVANVIVPIVSSRPSEGMVSTGALTFTANDWSVPRTVTVTGQPDGVPDENQPYVVTVGRTTSADPLYAGRIGLVELVNVGDPLPSSCLYGASVYNDLSLGLNAASGYIGATLVDRFNGKVLLVTNNQGQGGGRVGLFRCNLDGNGCAFVDISAGQVGLYTGMSPSAALDRLNQKLLVVSRNDANGSRPSLYRCNLDGTQCSHVDISAGQGNNTGGISSIAVDERNEKLVAAVQSGISVGLFRCNLDGTGCTYTKLPGGGAHVLIDTANAKLLVVGASIATIKPGVVRCNLDATSCTYIDISAGQPDKSGLSPSAAIDAATGKLLVVTRNGNTEASRPGLFRCNLDGTSCTHTDISGGLQAGSVASPSLVVDAARSRMLVATYNGHPYGPPPTNLIRCGLDGTACSNVDISAGQGDFSAQTPEAVLDDANGRLLVGARNYQNDGRAALYRVCVQ